MIPPGVEKYRKGPVAGALKALRHASVDRAHLFYTMS
jgi:hypothetical protein